MAGDKKTVVSLRIDTGASRQNLEELITAEKAVDAAKECEKCHSHN